MFVLCRINIFAKFVRRFKKLLLKCVASCFLIRHKFILLLFGFVGDFLWHKCLSLEQLQIFMQDENPVMGKTGYFFENADTLHLTNKGIGRRV